MGGVLTCKYGPQRQKTMWKENYAVKDSKGNKENRSPVNKKEGIYGGRECRNRNKA